MVLFTGKGDGGTTSLYDKHNGVFGCDQRISKNSVVAEALGSLDEINSFLGLCKVQADHLDCSLNNQKIRDIVHQIQKDLFIIQAELAGAEKRIEKTKVKELEDLINIMEKKMPPIKSFFISGGPSELETDQLALSGLGAMFDVARTIVRRAERAVIRANEETSNKSLFDENQVNELDGTNKEKSSKQISKHTLAYLNRLSSILYALARYSNHLANISEEAPDYR